MRNLGYESAMLRESMSTKASDRHDLNSDDKRMIGREQCERIIKRAYEFTEGKGITFLSITCLALGDMRWARNRVTMASDRRNVRIYIERHGSGMVGKAATDQLDDASLEATVRAAERNMVPGIKPPEPLYPPTPRFELLKPAIWSDATYNVTAEMRGALVSGLTKEAEEQNLLSAGYIEMKAGEMAVMNYEKEITYYALTQAQCSITVRHPKGKGSGWAGLTGYDWATMDGDALAKRALDKCVKSLNPVRIEPGRYTVVLEPQAVGDFVTPLVNSFDRGDPEMYGRGPWFLEFDKSLGLRRSKLGLKIIDERITIGHNPMDPKLGIVPYEGLKSVNWIKNGVLTNLVYHRRYALLEMTENEGSWWRDSFSMSGGNTSIDEMIQSTKRGIYVTRMNGVLTMDAASLMSTGVTRDGLWLIENGKISKAVHNMRFTDSPIFMLNQVEQLGVPVPIFRPSLPLSAGLRPSVVPPLKAKDFSFTALVDAV